ncbi:hypothetical protein QIO85_gp3 [ssRNA phage Gephyllon.4_11]|uniref:Uncharacterized protein n=2 Tax=Leviviricetes TaxID=2842243 RepID=A0A8S5L2U9_9VIRU|nr:hypothetical protein QIO85_gp3 [ssRNA phage Gephyllon.4_11]QDH89802.1 MAG: hypothetical protein H4BulkLitter23312_000002 [Leviviridae sp.]QDH90102.1 MAG: hypothetical protein H4BulkLitter223084_000001 [Leviviridae sp.]DAD51993.1 TPA_asm: hypothetical protein [ssRNA phage Gephyllon.4_11]
MAPKSRIPSTIGTHRDSIPKRRKEDHSYLQPRSRVVAIVLGLFVILSDSGFFSAVADEVSNGCF